MVPAAVRRFALGYSFSAVTLFRIGDGPDFRTVRPYRLSIVDDAIAAVSERAVRAALGIDIAIILAGVTFFSIVVLAVAAECV